MSIFGHFPFFRVIYPTLCIAPLLQSNYVPWIFQCIELSNMIFKKFREKFVHVFQVYLFCEFVFFNLFFQLCYHWSYFNWLVILLTLNSCFQFFNCYAYIMCYSVISPCDNIYYYTSLAWFSIEHIVKAKSRYFRLSPCTK